MQSLRRSAPPSLETYAHTAILQPAPLTASRGKKGTGLLLLHRRDLHEEVWSVTEEPYLAIWLRQLPSTTGLPCDLFVAAVYLPPGRLADEQEQIWGAPLEDQIDMERRLGLVVMLGDFNARLGGLEDRAATEVGHGEHDGTGTGLRHQRLRRAAS